MKKSKLRKLISIKNIKNVVLTAVIFVVIGFISLVIIFIFLVRDIPDPNTIITRKVSESTKIYDGKKETILYDVHDKEKRTIVPWENISDSIKHATLAIEDPDFYKHQGIDLRGIARAFFENIKNLQTNQGGSTITQQLVKNALVGTEKTYTRKIKEIVLAIEIERRFSKDEIFWMYLNQIPYGSNVYGIEAASNNYFGTSAQNLTNSQAAILASMLQAPTFYSPYGNHVDALIGRQQYALKRMFEFGYISENDYKESLNEKTDFKKPTQKIIAPHFVFMVREYLINQYGEQMVENGGLKVTTTLDLDLQNIAEEIIYKKAKTNETTYNAKNAALVSIDPKTGHIKALVGSKNYFDIENQGNFNVATASRQPGSSFKPFAYATAIKNGFTDSTVVFDLKTEFSPRCSSDASSTSSLCYNPNNYDSRFRGPVTLRQALQGSLNIPAVKVLYLAGIDNTINTATSMGITTLNDRDRYGLALVLGGAEVKLVDMVSAYGVFANEGIRDPSSFILKVEDSEGNVLEEWKQKEERVLDTQVARIMNNMLSDNEARSYMFGSNSSLYIPGRPVAAKTGTTQNNRDAWLIGYTPSLVTGVWIGNNDNTKMNSRAIGGSVAGPIWNEFMRKALDKTPVENFTPPELEENNKIMLDGHYGSIPNVHTLLYYVDKNNPKGPYPSNPYSDPMFANWEAAIRRVYGPIQMNEPQDYNYNDLNLPESTPIPVFIID